MAAAQVEEISVIVALVRSSPPFACSLGLVKHQLKDESFPYPCNPLRDKPPIAGPGYCTTAREQSFLPTNLPQQGGQSETV